MIPGGLLARELALGGFLDRQLGVPGLGLIVAAVLRLVWLVAEILISSILYPLRPRSGG
jgi:hypothetical protein